MGGGPGMPPGYGGPPQMEAPSPDQSGGDTTGAAGAQRGFILTIRCTTPYAQGVRLIDETFIQNLLALKPGAIPADKPFYIAKAGFARRDSVKNDTVMMAKLQSDWNIRQQHEAAPPGGAGGPGGQPFQGGNPYGGYGGAPGIPAGAAVPAAAFEDPILHEDVRDDTEATIVIAVVLDPPPVVAAAKP